MAIANGTCVRFCNQPKAHYLATSRESRRYVVALSRFSGGGIWLRQESLRHMYTASPEYASVTIAVNVTWMERGFNACQTHHSMYPSIFNRFPVIQPVGSKVRHFSTFLHILATHGYAPGTIAVNIIWIERGFNAGQTHSNIYPSIFNRLRAIARYWSEIAIFSYPLHLTPPLRVFPLEFREKFGPQKTRIMGLPGSKKVKVKVCI